jgi:hypothetical protein
LFQRPETTTLTIVINTIDKRRVELSVADNSQGLSDADKPTFFYNSPDEIITAEYLPILTIIFLGEGLVDEFNSEKMGVETLVIQKKAVKQW